MMKCNTGKRGVIKVLWAGQRGTDLDHDSDVFCGTTEGDGMP